MNSFVFMHNVNIRNVTLMYSRFIEEVMALNVTAAILKCLLFFMGIQTLYVNYDYIRSAPFNDAAGVILCNLWLKIYIINNEKNRIYSYYTTILLNCILFSQRFER